MVSDARDVLGHRAHIVAVNQPATTAYTGRPRTYMELYQAAARTCPGLSWTILAAIGQVESDHGRNVGPSSAGALGPMQFLPSTWAVWGLDADADHKADIMDPYDAVYSAARYLCYYNPGAGLANLKRAVFAYNHADWYVAEVIALAKLYR
jgi:membrane-bound lytic murein transglycosylase B